MPENTVVVAPSRYGALTVVSLTLNGVALLLILIGLICHHPHRHHRGHFHDQGPDWQDRGGDRNNGMRFHRGDFGGMDRNREGGPVDGNGWNKGPDGNRDPFRNAPGGPGHPGFGGPGGMPHMQIPAVPDVTDHIMKHLTTQLALTDDQAKQIRPVVEQQATSLQKDMESQREFLAKSVEDTTAKIRPLLNADQQKKLDQIKSFVADKLNSAKPEQAAPAAKPKE